MKPALLVIDFINDIAHRDGKIARFADRIEKGKVIEHANTAIAHARKEKWPLIFVKVGFHAGYPECPKSSPLFSGAAANGALQLGTWGTQFHDKLDVHPDDLTLVKHRVSCFYATPLEAILRAQGVQKLVLCGIATHMAIESTTRDAHDRDYAVYVLQDACQTMSDEVQKASLENIGRLAKLIDSSSLSHLL